MPIRKQGSVWRIDNVPAKFKSKEAALRALRAIKANQKKRKMK